MRIPLHQLTLQPNFPAGLNPLRVMSFADDYRNAGPPPPPIRVEHLNGGWVVREGRHRVLGAWIAGCADIEAEELPDAAPASAG